MTLQLSGLVDHANRSNVVINTLDARGLYTSDFMGDISEAGSDPPQMVGPAAEVRNLIQLEQQFVLMDFASGTGGRFFHNSNDLEGGLKQLGDAPDVSYVLGFSPQKQIMDGRFHTIKVTPTGKQKYAIQAMRGYFAPKKLENPVEIAKQEIREAVFSRDEIQDLPFSMQTQYFKSEGAEAHISIVSHVDLNGLRFRKADGRNYNDVTVGTVLFDENGHFVAGGGETAVIRCVTGKAASPGLVFKVTYEVKPGKYLVRQVVRESEGSQMGSRNGTAVIPV